MPRPEALDKLADYIMQNAGLDEAQAGIRMAGQSLAGYNPWGHKQARLSN